LLLTVRSEVKKTSQRLQTTILIWTTLNLYPHLDKLCMCACLFKYFWPTCTVYSLDSWVLFKLFLLLFQTKEKKLFLKLTYIFAVWGKSVNISLELYGLFFLNKYFSIQSSFIFISTINYKLQRFWHLRVQITNTYLGITQN